MKYPHILATSVNVDVILCDKVFEVHEQSLEMILDLDQFGMICGIEILNLVLETGVSCLDMISRSFPSPDLDAEYSYDADADAFYLKLTDSRSLDQDVVSGAVALNRCGEIVRFSASRSI